MHLTKIFFTEVCVFIVLLVAMVAFFRLLTSYFITSMSRADTKKTDLITDSTSLMLAITFTYLLTRIN